MHIGTDLGKVIIGTVIGGAFGVVAMALERRNPKPRSAADEEPTRGPEYWQGWAACYRELRYPEPASLEERRSRRHPDPCQGRKKGAQTTVDRP